MQPLNWILLTVILLEVCWLEVFRVLGISKDAAEGWKAISIVRESSLTPSVDYLTYIHYGGCYFLIVTATLIVLAAVLLVWWSWNLVARWTFVPGALGTGNFLLLLDSLLLLLVVAVMVAWSAASLGCCRSCSPGSCVAYRGQRILLLELRDDILS